LTDFQKSFHNYIENHDRNLANQLRSELAGVRGTFEKRFSDLERKNPEGVEERFEGIAVAARALAESAGPFPTTGPQVS